MGARCGGHGISGRPRTDDGGGFDRQTSSGNSTGPNRKQPENILGRHSNRSDAGRAGSASGTSAAGQSGAGFRRLSARNTAPAGERHDLFLLTSQNEGSLRARGGELHAVRQRV